MKETSDKLKIWILERVLKNLYHAESVKCSFLDVNDENPNKCFGYITIKDVDLDQSPEVCDVCDEGLRQEVNTEIVSRKEELSEYFGKNRVAINIDIWFELNPHVEIERLENLLKMKEEQLELEQ